MMTRATHHMRHALRAWMFGLATLAATAELAHAEGDEAAEGGGLAEKKAEGAGMVKIVISYALALGGLGVVGVAVIESFQKNLSYPSAKLGLINLLRTSPNNAEMVCRSMPGTFYEPIAAAFKTAAMIGPQPAAIYPTATRPAYDGGAVVVAMKWKQLFGKAKLGAMAAAGGLALVASAGTLPIPIIFAVLLVIGGMVRLFVHKAEVDRTIVLARAEVLPEVDHALASGRYAFPPKPAG